LKHRQFNHLLETGRCLTASGEWVWSRGSESSSVYEGAWRM